MEEEGLSMTYPQEVDIGLQKFVARRRLSAAQSQHLVAAVEKLWPGTKYKLPYTHGQLSAVSHMQLAHHTIPMPWNCALCLAHWMAMAGKPRLGGVLLLQWSTGLRPMEALSLQTQQLTRPDENPSGNLGIITLAPKSGTKVGRPQFVLLWPDRQAVALTVLERFRRTSERGCCLTAINDVGSFNRILEKACKSLGLPRFTAHSPRAGWATAQRLAGRPFGEIQEEGRWDSERSLRRYLDALAAVEMRVATQHLDATAEWLKGNFNGRFAWWP